VRNRDPLALGDLTMIGVGFVVAFISALLVLRRLWRYVAHHDFVPFAWYRIAFGLVILGTAYAGLVRWD
jgi:undecaprenyl-diphosphatase